MRTPWRVGRRQRVTDLAAQVGAAAAAGVETHPRVSSSDDINGPAEEAQSRASASLARADRQLAEQAIRRTTPDMPQFLNSRHV
jgi:hypothetical protein